MQILETERLRLRHLDADDASFLLELLNEPAFIDNIADKGVRTLADVDDYLRDGPLASYARHGFGLYLVELKQTSTPIGICGLLRREGLDDPDLGYALLTRYSAQGYATEAARAALEFGHATLGLGRVMAISKPDNRRSIHVLEKIGFRYLHLTDLPGHEGPSALFVSKAQPAAPR
jgi:RimJ/RimL family protein N-acetyltransferase